MATEIEKQTIKWLAEFIDVPSTYGGVLVSGGNMANFTAFLASRTAKSPKIIKEDAREWCQGRIFSIWSFTSCKKSY